VSYRFARRPAWIFSHVFAVASVVALAALGLWQLDRHDQRAARNDAVTARAELAPVPVADALDEVDDPADLRFRQVTAAGTYAGPVLLVDNRSLEGLPGAWVLAPLRQDDGTVLVVNRGFAYADDGEVRPPAPAGGRVELTGTVASWEGSCGVRRDDGGNPVGTACLNREAAEDAFGTGVLPVVVQRQEATPPEADLLLPVPAPELGAGPHRSYAVQWFTFATMAAVTYVLILRRRARADDAEETAPVTDVTSVSGRS